MMRSRTGRGLGAKWLGTASAVAMLAACGGQNIEPTPDVTEIASMPFMDESLSPEARAKDIVARMTLEEKAAQMYDKTPAIKRLGVPRYEWWNEALHGVARAGEATVFPQAIGLAATWDEDLMLEVATVISDEGRAKNNQFLSEGVREMYTGITFWSPNINIFRDPRWGRGQETYGEDPFLTGRMAVNFINGLQGDDETYLKTIATVKHYAVHSGPEPSRHSDDYDVTDADLRETYLTAFKIAFDNTDVASVMCAYNAFQGAPACGSERLMETLLRGDLGFDGYVVSDCGAIGDFYYADAHAHVETRTEAAALAVRSGTDVNCGDGEGNKMDALPDAVAQGLITEAAMDQAVERLFTARFKLGMFDENVPYRDIPFDIVGSDKHIALSEEAARKSLVLLKNDGVLPLAEGTKVAVIGPNADNWMTLVANYYGLPTQAVTALDGITAKVGGTNVTFSPGSTIAADVYKNYEIVPQGVLFHEDENGDLQPGLVGEYYTEVELGGDLAKTQIDPAIDFYWYKSPVDDSRNDHFSVKWTGVIVPEEDGAFRIQGSRWTEVSINGELMGDTILDMEAGQRYEISTTFSIGTMWYRNTIEPESRLRWVDTSRDLHAEAMAAAAAADVVLFFGGIDANLEGEEMDVAIDGFLGGDRTHLNLPKVQVDLLKDLKATGKPLVVVNFSGSAMALNWADANANAIVQAFYPGEKAGNAIADLLWGEFSPSGRLPVTFYKSLDGMPAFDDYSMENRTYKYYAGEPLYKFGYGLSYTDFSYGKMSVPETHDGRTDMTVSVMVTNDGPRQGREIVQAYIQHQQRVNRSVPRVELVAFDVVDLAPGESQTVTFTLSPERLGYYDDAGDLVMPQSGTAILSLGAGQPDADTASSIVTFIGD